MDGRQQNQELGPPSSSPVVGGSTQPLLPSPGCLPGSRVLLSGAGLGHEQVQGSGQELGWDVSTRSSSLTKEKRAPSFPCPPSPRSLHRPRQCRGLGAGRRKDPSLFNLFDWAGVTLSIPVLQGCLQVWEGGESTLPSWGHLLPSPWTRACSASVLRSPEG